jgi:tetratricopeptide (TPR) repeat protein
LRRYDASLRHLARAAELSDNPTNAHVVASRVALLAGDVPEARRLLALSAQDRLGSSEIRVGRFWTAIDSRDYDAALDLSADIPEVNNGQFSFECRAAARGWALKLRGDEAGARAELVRARPLIEAYVRDHPAESNVRSVLAKVLVALGEPEPALREARAALTLPPATTDLWIRHWRLYDLAVVETFAGRHDDAVAHLHELLAQPSDQASVGLLRVSPQFDALRKHPGFLRLLEERPGRPGVGP